jgi:hypothetical protein
VFGGDQAAEARQECRAELVAIVAVVDLAEKVEGGTEVMFP